MNAESCVSRLNYRESKKMTAECTELTFLESVVDTKEPVLKTWWTSNATLEDLRTLCSSKPLTVQVWSVSRVDYREEHFVLRKPIRLEEALEGGMWTCHYGPLGIVGYGPSKAEAWDAFQMEFACCWHEIALEDDSNLTEDARQLKTRLLDLVE